MTKARTDFPLATDSWDQAEQEAIARVVERGRFTMGPLVRQFEEDFAARVGSRYAIMVNSGSSANLIAVAAAVLNPDVPLAAGDEVLVPAVSWATTYFPLQQYGLTLRFVDVDIDTLNVDLDLLAGAIGPRTRAIVAVNLLGNPIDWDRLSAIAADHDLVVIEDNCESLGARFGSREAGTFGVMGTYSTFFSHHISTMEGGVVVTDDERLSQMLTSLRAHGWVRELPEQNWVHDKTGDPFRDLFCFALPGYNVRPLEIEGAIGVEQVKKISGIVAARRENGSYWTRVMSAVPDVRIQRETGKSSWFGFSMILEGALRDRRSALGAALSEAGIESRPVVAGNFVRNPAMAYLTAEVPDALPAADAVHDRGLFVGNRAYPSHDSIDIVAEIVERVART